jgi:hypothetical protein
MKRPVKLGHCRPAVVGKEQNCVIGAFLTSSVLVQKGFPEEQ